MLSLHKLTGTDGQADGRADGRAGGWAQVSIGMYANPKNKRNNIIQ